MNNSAEEITHTIRDDTAKRHLHKYTNTNPLHRATLGRFFDRLTSVLQELAPRTVFEFGCGEGLLLRELKARGFSCTDLVGIDLRAQALADARSLHPEWRFDCVDLFQWTPKHPKFELVLASQVLEHIPNPEPILKRLIELTERHLVLTVPCEPWFQLLNLLRGRDLLRLGNHPEHVNRWSKAEFVKFVSQHVTVVSAEVVFPFTVVVAKPK